MKLHNRCVSVKPLLDAWTPLPELWDWEILCNGLDVQCQYTDCNLCYIEVASCLFVNPPQPTWLWPSTLSGCLGALWVHQLSMVNYMISWNPQSLIYGPIHDYLHPMDQDVSDPHPGEILMTPEYIFFEAFLLYPLFYPQRERAWAMFQGCIFLTSLLHFTCPIFLQLLIASFSRLAFRQLVHF